MQVTLRKLSDSIPALRRLMTQPLAARVAYTLVKTTHSVESELQALEQARVAAVTAHGGTPNEKTKQYDFPDGEKEAFTKDYDELLDQAVEIPGPIKLAQIERTQLSVDDMAALAWLVEE